MSFEDRQEGRATEEQIMARMKEAGRLFMEANTADLIFKGQIFVPGSDAADKLEAAITKVGEGANEAHLNAIIGELIEHADEYGYVISYSEDENHQRVVMLKKD